MADGINFGLIPAATQVVQPFDTGRALAELENAVRTGFITAEDISRAGRRKVQESDQLKTDLQANDLRRKLMPGEAQNQQAAQEVQAGNLGIQRTLLPGQQVLAEKQNQDILDLTDPTRRADALNRKRREGVEVAYTQSVGELPDFFELEKPGKAQSFDKWQEQQHQQILQQADAAAAQFPDPNSVEANQARAKVFNDLESQFALNSHNAYSDYVKKVQSEKAKVLRGTPEYDKEVANRLTQHIQQQAIQGAQLQALPKVLENQAKGPEVQESKVERFNPATGKVEDVLVRTDKQTGAVLGETVLGSKPPKLTESEANAQIYATRLDFNNNVLSELEKKQFNPTAIGSTVQKYLPNRFNTADFQQYNAAKMNWIAAAMRRESGAAISQSELTGADKQYFPQDGDSPEAVAQKQRLRQVVEDEMRKISGPAGASAPAAPTSTSPTSGYEALVGKRVTLKNGQSGVVIRNADGTYSLQP